MLFKLTAERDSLICALHKDFGPDDLDTMLSRWFNIRLYDVDMMRDIGYPKVVEKVVLKAEAEVWTWELIRAMVETQPRGPNVIRFLQLCPHLDPTRVQAPPITDPLLSCSLRAGRILIDRAGLRTALRRMRDDPDAPRVLVVTGERASGKTYSRELLRHFTGNALNHELIYVDLDEYPHDEADLAKSIGLRVGMDPSTMPPRRDLQKPAWIAKLAEWIISYMSNPGEKVYWCVFDGFREQQLLSHTKDLIDALAVRAEDIRQCRIVLLNYDEMLPPEINEYVDREEIKPIGRSELLDFLRQVNSGKGGPHPPRVLEEKANVILEQVQQFLAANPDQQLQRLRFINRATSETIKQLHLYP